MPLDTFQPDFDFAMIFDGLANDRAPTENFATAYGVTQTTWLGAIVKGIIPDKSINDATKADCMAILKAMFYDANKCGAMPAGYGLMVFNHGMACGVRTAAFTAQRIVGVAQDGVIGPATLAAIRAYGDAFIDAMKNADELYYAGLRNADVYLRGWDRREDAAAALAHKMAKAALAPRPGGI